MKQYTHAWLAMKAIKVLESYQGLLKPPHDKNLEEFCAFISAFQETFVRGAWFPDQVIQDNLQGGHTWKYYLDPVDGKLEKRRPPAHNQCLALVSENLNQKVSLDLPHSALPDRCEALGQMIRDTTLITNKTESGDVVAFNNSQIALSFLMLAHYVCDAHVPLHCDRRDFGDPSPVHNDLEGYWEDEVKRVFRISRGGKEFVLDEVGNMQYKVSQADYEASIFFACDRILAGQLWQEHESKETGWNTYLGKGNNNFWDYMVSVCLVSYFVSLRLFPEPAPAGINYQTLKVMQTSPFKEDIGSLSPKILADAINSVAIAWLSAWERWKLLKKQA